MVEGSSREFAEHSRAKRTEHHAAQTVSEGEDLPEQENSSSYPGSLLGDARLNKRGNWPVKAAVMRQMQQTHGNRAVQRLLAGGEHSIRRASAVTPIQRLVVIQREVEIAEDLRKELPPEMIEYLQKNPPMVEAEQRIHQWSKEKNVTFEIGLIYDGQTLRKANKGTARGSGAVAAVTFKDSDWEGIQEKALTHTHPDGGPLSRPDVSMAVGRNLREVRAIGPHGIFILKRGDNVPDWGITTTNVFDAFSKDGKAAWGAACPGEKRGWGSIDGTAPHVSDTFATDAYMSAHFAAKLLASNSGGRILYIPPQPDDYFIAMREKLYSKDARPNERAGLGHHQDLAIGSKAPVPGKPKTTRESLL